MPRRIELRLQTGSPKLRDGPTDTTADDVYCRAGRRITVTDARAFFLDRARAETLISAGFS
jgi:hypothetical protein